MDTYLDYIEAVDYDGGNRKTILRGSPVQNLYSASVFENSLYLTSWRNNSILRVNKFQAEWLFNLNRICFVKCQKTCNLVDYRDFFWTPQNLMTRLNIYRQV